MLPPPLVALSPGDLGAGDAVRFLTRVERALAAGLRGVLLREPRLGDRAWLELHAELARRARGFADAWLGVHDRAHLALLVGADALHLGYRSLTPLEVRGLAALECAAGSLTLGLSTHAADDSSIWRAADYLFHGPVRETPSKVGLFEPTGFDGLERAVARATCPVLALGGMRPADVAPALEAGAHGVAVLSGILGAGDPGVATEEYLAALASSEAIR